MGTAANIQLGMGDLSIKDYVAGTYDTFDPVGFHSEKGAAFAYKADVLKVKSGNGLGTTKIFFTGEEATLEIAIQEFTAAIVAKSLGLADADITDDAVNFIKSFYIGGNTAANYFSAQFKVPFDVAGLYGQLTIFKGRFSGDVKLDMEPKKNIDTPWKIECMSDDAAGDSNGRLAMMEFKYQ